MNTLEDGSCVVDEELVGLGFTGRSLQDADFEDVVFRQCRLSQSSLVRCRFTSCTFIECDLGSSSLKNSTLNGVLFDGCRLLGVDFSAVQAAMLGLEFRDCLLDYCGFSRLPLSRTSFLRCRLHDADFSGATLSQSVFTGSDLLGARFHRATLERADFRGAANLCFNPSSVRLRNTRIELDALIRIGEQLGLTTH